MPSLSFPYFCLNPTSQIKAFYPLVFHSPDFLLGQSLLVWIDPFMHLNIVNSNISFDFKTFICKIKSQDLFHTKTISIPLRN